MLAWGSGLRISEIKHLKPEDIDVEDKRIRVNEGKGCKDWIVPLPVDWQEHHMNHIPIKCSTRAIQKAFEMYAELSGLTKKKPKVFWHSFRFFSFYLIAENYSFPVKIAFGNSL